MVEEPEDGPSQIERDNVYLLPLPGNVPGVPTRKGRARDAEAARLKALGWSLIDIAKRLGIGDESDHERAEIRVAAAIKRSMATATRFARDEARFFELIALDELELRLWKLLDERQVLVQHGKVIEVDGVPLDDNRFALEVMDRILKCRDQRCRVLGTFAPTRVEQISIDSVESEILRLEAELNGKRPA